MEQNPLVLSTLAKTWIFDLDGTIVKHNGYKTDGRDSLLPGAREYLETIPPKDKVIFLTSREEKYREATVRFLTDHGIRYDVILFELPVGERNVDFINKNAMNGTILAHTDGNVPNLMVNIPRQDEFSLGQLFYFFEFACGISGYLLGVNPFNQPGVESYKKNMFALLGKPGYEAEREELLKRLWENAFIKGAAFWRSPLFRLTLAGTEGPVKVIQQTGVKGWNDIRSYMKMKRFLWCGSRPACPYRVRGSLFLIL